MSSESGTPLTAEAAAAKLLADHPAKIVKATAFFHEREQVTMLSVEVTDFSVMEEVDLEANLYHGFEIIWGFHIPDGAILQ